MMMLPLLLGLIIGVVILVFSIKSRGTGSPKNTNMMYGDIEQNDVIQGNTLCSACNKENPTGSGFCEYCGAKIEGGDVESGRGGEDVVLSGVAPRKRFSLFSLKGIAIVIGALAFLIPLMSLIFGQGGSDNPIGRDREGILFEDIPPSNRDVVAEIPPQGLTVYAEPDEPSARDEPEPPPPARNEPEPPEAETEPAQVFYIVPDLTGRRFEGLMFDFLILNPVFEFNYEYEMGVIFEQSISPQTEVMNGTEITVKVSMGAAYVELPSYAGMWVNDYAEILSGMRIKYDTRGEFSDSIMEGYVIGCSVDSREVFAGSMISLEYGLSGIAIIEGAMVYVERGDIVTIYYSLGVDLAMVLPEEPEEG
jgi:hypothetical protein